jgi:hypothetical protein
MTKSTPSPEDSPRPPVVRTATGEPLYLTQIDGQTVYFFWEEINCLLNCGTIPPTAVPPEYFDDPGVVWG